MSDREDYEAFLATSRQRSVFAQPWWLDIVSGNADAWEPNVLRADAGPVRAAWPLPTRRTAGRLVGHGAPYTPFVGPMLPGASAVSTDVELLEALAELLETSHSHVEAPCMPELDYWTPLHWHGYTQTTRTTWRITAGQSPEQVRAAMRTKTRGKLRAAERDGLTVGVGSVEDLLTACEATFDRQDISDVPAREVLRRLATAALEREQGEILAVRTSDGVLVSAGFFVFDDRWTWSLANGHISHHGATGAPTLLITTAIEHAMARGTGFDFEGSMLKPVEQFVRGFGGTPVMYSVVARSTREWARAVARKRRIKRLLRR